MVVGQHLTVRGDDDAGARSGCVLIAIDRGDVDHPRLDLSGHGRHVQSSRLGCHARGRHRLGDRLGGLLASGRVTDLVTGEANPDQDRQGGSGSSEALAPPGAALAGAPEVAHHLGRF